MTSSGQGKAELLTRMTDLTALRDQIRVDLHLAGMDLQDEWKKLEKKLPDLEHALKPLESATREALEARLNELRRFDERLRDGR